MHHPNGRPVGGAKIGHAEEPVSAAGTVLSPYYPGIYYHRTRARVINYWHQGRQRAASVPPDHPRRKNEENRSRTARGCHAVPVGICANQTGLLRNVTKWALNNYCWIVHKPGSGLSDLAPSILHYNWF
jgi:hypothetical protein